MAMKRKNLPAVMPELFEHEQFGQFRFIKRDDEIWFAAVDVCRALELADVTSVLRALDDDRPNVENFSLRVCDLRKSADKVLAR